jgi:hypothetical protein
VSCPHSLQCHVFIRFSVISSFASVSYLHSLQCHVFIRFSVISSFALVSCLHSLQCHVFIISAAGSRYFSFKCSFYVLESLSPLLLYSPPISLSKAVNLLIAFSRFFLCLLHCSVLCRSAVCGHPLSCGLSKRLCGV